MRTLVQARGYIATAQRHTDEKRQGFLAIADRQGAPVPAIAAGPVPVHAAPLALCDASAWQGPSSLEIIDHTGACDIDSAGKIVMRPVPLQGVVSMLTEKPFQHICGESYLMKAHSRASLTNNSKKIWIGYWGQASPAAEAITVDAHS